MEENNLQVRWKHHQLGVMDYLRQLLVSEIFVDVTLCCQNKRFKAHRILLSACSSYLQQVLVEHLSSDHITIIIPDIDPEDMQSLLDFMYTGSVAVPRCRLTSFLHAAETLHIKILTDMAQLQKAKENDIITCIPASSPSLDVKLTNDENFSKDKLKTDIDGQELYNLSADMKMSINSEAYIQNKSANLLTNELEFKNNAENRASCMFKCSRNSPILSTISQNPKENHTSIDTVTTSSYTKLSKYNCNKTDICETNKEERNIGTRDGAFKSSEVKNSHCNTNDINTGQDSSNLSHCSLKNALPYDKSVYNKISCERKNVAVNSNSNQFSIPSPTNLSSKLTRSPQTESAILSNRTGTTEGIGSPTEYGLHPSTTDDLHEISKENKKTNSFGYRQDIKLNENTPPRNQHRNDHTLSPIPEHFSDHFQRLSQWPKPIPSLMPISNTNNNNNSFHYNGPIPTCYYNKDRLNGTINHNHQYIDSKLTDKKEHVSDHIQNIKDVIPGITDPYQYCNLSTTQHMKCLKGMWFPGTDRLVHLNGQRPPTDCSPLRRTSQKIPRLSPIVPPSPWAQNHRTTCPVPFVCSPREGNMVFNYRPNWFSPQLQPTGLGEINQHVMTNQQSRNDMRSSSTPGPIANSVPQPSKTPSPHISQVKELGSSTNNNQPVPIRKRSPENVDVFCRLKERRLHDFYKEQMSMKLKNGTEFQEKEDEVASDLSTKSSQSPTQSPHSISARSSPSDYQKVINSPVTLHHKIKTTLPVNSCLSDDSYADIIKEENNTTSKNCDTDGKVELNLHKSSLSLIDEPNCYQQDISKSEKDNENQCASEAGDIQIVNEEKPHILGKNDSNNNNNNNNNDTAQTAPAAKSHGCEDCGKCFSRRQLLVQHRRIHTGERPYSCADCGRQFTQRGHWSTHQKLHEPTRRPEHACPSCGKAFVTRASLKVHLRTHTGEKPFQCGECGKQFSQLRNYKYHRSVHEGTREFAATCPECGKYFNDRGYLSSHMKIHRNRKEYGCQYCGKSFNQRVAYNMHVRIHTGERPHSCPHCNKSFSRKMLLKQHLRIHTGEKPFACSVCGKAFADRSNMTLHMRLHSGIKPYSCQLCAKAFTKKHHLKTHLNYHTGTKPYSCSKCGLRFSQSSNMRTHYKKCTSTGPSNAEAPVSNTETSNTPVVEGNGAPSPSSSPGRSDVTMTSPRSSTVVITPPHSDESSCASSVISRNSIQAQTVNITNAI